MNYLTAAMAKRNELCELEGMQREILTHERIIATNYQYERGRMFQRIAREELPRLLAPKPSGLRWRKAFARSWRLYRGTTPVGSCVWYPWPRRWSARIYFRCESGITAQSVAQGTLHECATALVERALGER